MDENFNKHLVKAPLSLRFYAAVLFLLSVVFILLLTLGRYGKQETVKGLVRSESFFRVAAKTPGNISELYVTEGESVAKGSPLFRLELPFQDAEDQQNGKSVVQESIRRLLNTRTELLAEEQRLVAEIESQKIQQGSYFESLKSSADKLTEIQNDNQKKKLSLTRQLQDYEQLLKSKSINKTEVESLRNYIADHNVAMKKVAIEIESLEQTRAEKEYYYARVQRELEQNSNDIARKKRDVFNELNKIQMQHDYIVSAPVDGIVHDIGVLRGDYVDGTTPAMSVQADKKAEPVVILYLSTSQIGLVEPREKVLLRVDTFPYEHYGVIAAKVVNISQTPTKISIDDKESHFRVKLQFDSTDEHSKIPLSMLSDGMSVTASLRQPPQTLFEWLFLPVKKAFQRNPDVIR